VYTFVALFGAPHDQDAAEELLEAGIPSAHVVTMPVQGAAFFGMSGEAGRELDRIWAERVPAASRPVVLLLHEEELPQCVTGLDAEFVIGVDSGDDDRGYADQPHVHVVASGDPIEVTRAAIRLWSDTGTAPGSGAAWPAEPDAGIDHDHELLQALFGEPAPSRDGYSPDAASGGELDRSSVEGLPVDPLSRLAAVSPTVEPRPGGGDAAGRPALTRRELFAVSEETGAVQADHESARSWLDRARSLVARRRPIEVPTEIGDLLLGTGPSPLVVVGSRKGGVGKTALSAGLAQVCGYSLDGRAGVAALVDQNINNADQWGRLMVPDGVGTVRDIMTALENGEEFPDPPAFARTPALAVYPESRDPGDGYPAALIGRFAHVLRGRHVITVIDLPNTVPAYTSAEASVAAGYIEYADLVLVPTTDDPNALRGVLEYLDTPSMSRKKALVPYIVSPERGIREDPGVLELLHRIRQRSAGLVPFPKTEKATLAVVKGTSILDVDSRLRNAFIDLAGTVARLLVRSPA
jgi:hypothetical protein